MSSMTYKDKKRKTDHHVIGMLNGFNIYRNGFNMLKWI